MICAVNSSAEVKFFIFSLEAVNSASPNAQGIHFSTKRDYPQAQPLPLPINIDPNESMRFSPQRARDINSTAISTNIWNQRSIDITIDSSQFDVKSDADPHVNSYDCSGAVSLNSSMQSNVPSPFGGMHKFTHLNMPGGQWSQSSKWMSHDLHSSHYTNLRREVRNNMHADLAVEKGMVILKNNACLHGNSSSSQSKLWMEMMRSKFMKNSFACLSQSDRSVYMICHLNASNQSSCRMFSDKKDVVKTEKNTDSNNETQNSANAQPETVALSPREKLKNAIKDYGSTVLVFHIAISLASLGLFYQLVSRLVKMGIWPSKSDNHTSTGAHFWAYMDKFYHFNTIFFLTQCMILKFGIAFISPKGLR